MYRRPAETAGMRYVLMSCFDLLQKHRDLLEKNFRESGNGASFDPPEDFYRALSENSPAFAFVAYDGEEAAGAASIFVAPHQHSGELTAYNDTIFVLPEYRGTTVPGRLFVLCEQEAKKRGCTSFQWACDEKAPLVSALKKRPHSGCQVAFIRRL
nr:MAG TPA: acetyltransferase domain containing protein [Caudoviricetes sp.]